MITGRATAEGTSRMARRFSQFEGSFRPGIDRCMMSSIGLGTFGGASDQATDATYSAAIGRATALGCNVIDTAPAYRHQRSERVVGATLEALVSGGDVVRDEIVVCSKVGFLPFDHTYPGTVEEYYLDTYLEPGLLSLDELAPPGHCVAPSFIEHELEQSRRNLRCQTIDVYCVHNPETQLRAVDRHEFGHRMRTAFETLEQAVADGRIGVYGISTWAGGRLDPAAALALDLSALVGCAAEVAGPDHHFRVVLSPINVAQPEAVTYANQRSPTRPGEYVPLLAAAQDLGLTVFAGAPLHRGRLACGSWRGMPSASGGLATPAQQALQVIRSTPGVTTAVAGMSRPEHVTENLEVTKVSRSPAAVVERVYRQSSEAA